MTPSRTALRSTSPDGRWRSCDFDPAQRQQVRHQPVHPPRLALHDAEEALARGGILARRAAQRLDEAQNRRQRRAQLVADVGDEIAPHLLGLAQMGDVAEMQEQRLPPSPAPRPLAHRRDAHAVLGLAGSGRRSASAPRRAARPACTASIRLNRPGWRSTVAQLRPSIQSPSSARRRDIGHLHDPRPGEVEHRLGAPRSSRLSVGSSVICSSFRSPRRRCLQQASGASFRGFGNFCGTGRVGKGCLCQRPGVAIRWPCGVTPTGRSPRGAEAANPA